MDYKNSTKQARFELLSWPNHQCLPISALTSWFFGQKEQIQFTERVSEVETSCAIRRCNRHFFFKYCAVVDVMLRQMWDWQIQKTRKIFTHHRPALLTSSTCMHDAHPPPKKNFIWTTHIFNRPLISLSSRTTTYLCEV